MKTLKEKLTGIVLERAVPGWLAGYDRPSTTDPSSGSIHVQKAESFQDLARFDYRIGNKRYCLELFLSGRGENVAATLTKEHGEKEGLKDFCREALALIQSVGDEAPAAPVVPEFLRRQAGPFAGSVRRPEGSGVAAPPGARPWWRVPIWCAETVNGGRVFAAADTKAEFLDWWPNDNVAIRHLFRVDEDTKFSAGPENYWLVVERLGPGPAKLPHLRPLEEGALSTEYCERKNGCRVKVTAFASFPAIAVGDGQTLDFQLFQGGMVRGIVWDSCFSGETGIVLTAV